MKNGIIVVLALLWSCMAFAADENKQAIKWDQPLQYEDGEPMAASEIQDFELHYTVNKTFEAMAKPIIIKANERSYVLELNLPAGVVPHTLSMGLKVRTIDGRKSDMSNVVVATFKVTDTRKPKAPTNIRLSITCGETCTITDQVVEVVE